MGLYSEHIFPRMIDRMLTRPGIQRRRSNTVGPASGDVLEIGFGTGHTLDFYDAGAVRSLSVIEPSEGMNRLARKRIENAPFPVHNFALAGESLPFRDANFDCVVSSLTLCSVKSQTAVLSEIFRVLRPNGRLRFFEHVESVEPDARKWQRRLNPVHRLVGVGCCIDRDTVQAIRKAGFALGPVQQEIEPDMSLSILCPVVEGEAIKPGDAIPLAESQAGRCER